MLATASSSVPDREEITRDLTESRFMMPKGSALEDVVDKWSTLLKLYNTDTLNLLDEWHAFLIPKSSLQMGPCDILMTLELLDEFSRKLLKDRRQQTASKTPVAKQMATPHSSSAGANGPIDFSDIMFDSETLNLMSILEPNLPRSPVASSSKTSAIVTEFATPKPRMRVNASLLASPVASKNMFRQSGMSPTIAPSPAVISYKERSNNGLKEIQINGHLFESYVTQKRHKRCDILGHPQNFLHSPYFYMYEKLSLKGQAMDSRIYEFSHSIANAYKLPPFENPTVARQSAVVTAGLIVCDGDGGRMNETSVQLQTSLESADGKRINLNLKDVPTFSIFPGQVVAVEGINSSGEELNVAKMYPGCAYPPASTIVRELENYHHGAEKMGGRPLTIFVASGPYTLDENLQYDPFLDLLVQVIEKQIDVLILTGPFVDADNSCVKSGDLDHTPEQIFQDYIADPLRRLMDSCPFTQIVLIPSTKDILHDYVFPQAPFNKTTFGIPDGILCYPNPSTFFINEMIFSVSSSDILLNMCAEEISSRTPDSNDRMGRLATHLLQQRSLYPLMPSALGSMVDLAHMKYLDLPCTPDFLVLPSDLKFFAKYINNSTVCVNPGRLVKKTSAGTFASFTVHPIKREKLKAEKENDVLPNAVYERTRIEILRI